MRNFKIAVLAVAALLAGCSNTPRENGVCATYVEGACLLKWVDGQKVPSGEVDMRFLGLSSDDSQGNFSGKVSVKVKEWK